MAQHGFGTAAQNRREPPAVRPERGVPHGVDAAVHPVQPAAVGPGADLAGREAKREELATRRDPVLAGGQLGDRAVQRT